MNNYHDKNRLLLFIYRELPEKEMQIVDAHLTECITCRKEFNLMQETINLHQKLPLETPLTEIIPNVLTLKQDAGSPKTRFLAWFEFPFSMQPRRWAIVSFCGLLMAVSLVVLFKQSSKHPTVTENTGSALFITQWQPPTDFLLISPGEVLLKTVPKLGESIININIIIPDYTN